MVSDPRLPSPLRGRSRALDLRTPALGRARPWWLSVWLLVLILTAPPSSFADKARTPPHHESKEAFAKLSGWVNRHGGQLGAVVLDLNTSERWVAIAPDKAMNPASNQKLVTAAVALDLLGPDYRYRTSCYGHIEDHKLRELEIEGHGDPSLGVEDLWRLARALKAQGVDAVEGDLWVDQSRFDDQFEPPAFDQQPHEWASFRAPVSAISVDQNTITLNVLATQAGRPARVWFEPPGVAKVSGTVKTVAAGGGQQVTWGVSAVPGGVKADLGGHVSVGQPRLRFVRRVADPRLLPGKVLAELLGELGVKFSGRVKLGKRDGGERLTYLTSPPLSVLLREMGKNSDNFYAETIFKTLAGESQGAPASSASAAERVLEWLEGAGLANPQTKIVNGSGLFDANRVSTGTLAGLLAKVYLDPSLGPDFLAQLAIGGVDGTLRHRFRSAKDRGRVRAKTGTLHDVDALGGYVLSSSGRLPIVFALLVNGIDNQHAAVRKEFDRAVSTLLTES